MERRQCKGNGELHKLGGGRWEKWSGCCPRLSEQDPVDSAGVDKLGFEVGFLVHFR